MSQHEDDAIEWAGFRIPSQIAANHFCMMGAIGSGISLLFRSHMVSALRQIDAGSDRRAVIVDARGDLAAFLQTAEVSCPIYNLNPYDAGGFRWDIGSDWTEPSMARHYAQLLVPDRADDSGKFFADTARRILETVLVVLMKAGQSWTLADLVDITTDRDRLRQTLLSAETDTQHLASPTTFANAATALAAAMETFEEIATAMKALPPQRGLGISKWRASKGSILVIGSNFELLDSLGLFYSLIFDAINHSASARLVVPAEWSDWFFLFDIGTLPRFDSLSKLLADGRTSGARVTFSCQDLEQLQFLYGDKVGSQLPALCGNRSILRLTSVDTAESAAQLASEGETFQCRVSGTKPGAIEVDLVKGFRGNKAFRPRSRCKPEDFLCFPMCEQGHVVGCHISQALGGAVVTNTAYEVARKQ